MVAGITPFNFPVMVPLWMCANAIACGNAFVLKPSEKDPSASLLLARWWQEAGLPDGVFTVLQGDKDAVDGLLTHPDVAALSFVGSTPIARYVYETGTAHGKRVQALGGAKNHMVVLPDADVDLAADAAVSAAYGAAGERCMAVSVAVAVGDVGDRLVDAIAARLPKLTIGDGAAPDTDMGPLITAEHRDKVAAYIGAGAEAGATVVVDGRDEDVPAEGFFLGTTLLDHVTTGHEGLHRRDLRPGALRGPGRRLRRGAARCSTPTPTPTAPRSSPATAARPGGSSSTPRSGMVGINVPIPVPVAYYSFGGWRSSLFGDKHMYGPEGISFYTRGKVVTSRWPDPTESQVDLGFPRTR